MLILITGLLPYDSGKTTFAEAVVRDLVNMGYDVGISKPISSVNCWYHYKYIIKAFESGVLVGVDTIRLHTVARSRDPIELEGPVTSLLIPPDPEKVGWDSAIYSAVGFHNQLVVIRISNVKGSKYYYIPQNLQRSIASVKALVESFLGDKNPETIDINEADELLVRSRPTADECLEYIISKHEVTVVESYNNAAAPTAKSAEADIVFVVAPGKVIVYEGKEFRKALFAVSSVKEPWKVTVEEVAQLAHPIDTVDLCPGNVEIDIQKWI